MNFVSMILWLCFLELLSGTEKTGCSGADNPGKTGTDNTSA